MKRVFLGLFFCYAEVAEAAINGSTLLRLCTSFDCGPNDDNGVRACERARDAY